MEQEFKPTQYKPQEFNYLVQNRRSMYPPQYTGEVVDEAIIEQMLENANWAPNHGRTEPWRFIVFTGAGIKSLAEYQADMYRQYTPADSFEDAKFEKLRLKPLTASHIIAIGMKRQDSGKIPEIEEQLAVACAVQNMHLTATVYGLGAYWSTGGVTYREEAKEFFGLESQDKLLGFFYIGIPKKMPPPGSRKPITEKVRWVRE